MNMTDTTTTWRTRRTSRFAALTVWEGLRWKTRVKPGERVLVHGATGGVGHLAVQLAVLDGAEVTASASSPEKRAMAREYVERITGGGGVDLVFDTVGGDVLAQSLAAARANRTVVRASTVAGRVLIP